MAIFYFPQWQGSFADNRLYPSAQVLRDFVVSQFGTPTIIDIPLDPSARLDRENGIIARQAIISQVRTAKNVLARTQPDRVFVLGGDCGIEIIPVPYLNAR
jgi:arginase